MLPIVETLEQGEITRLTTGTRVLGLVPITANCYQLGTTLIDAGAPNRAARLAELVEPSSIETVLLTHHHEDHVGLAARLAKAGARVMAPKETCHHLAGGFPMHRYRRYTWGRPDPVEAQPLGSEVKTPDGRFQVLPTPGHSPDHVAFFEPDRGLLFSGDSYLGRRQELKAHEDLAEIVASLERLRALEPELLLPGHGRIVDRPEKALTRAIDHFTTLREQAAALAGQGRSTAQIQRELLGRERFLRWFTQGDFQKRHLAEELLAWSP